MHLTSSTQSQIRAVNKTDIGEYRSTQEVIIGQLDITGLCASKSVFVFLSWV